MSSTTLAKPTRGTGGAAAAAHAAVSAVSPGREDGEEKNQDRLMLVDTDDGKGTRCRFAIVCDGTSTSPYSAAAAEYVSGRVREMFEQGGIGRAAAALEEMRLALRDKPLKLEEGQSDLLRSMFEEIVRQKYQHAYQTTFAAVCLKRGEAARAGTVLVKAVACGDTALFVFRDDGELLYNNVNLGGALDPFKHGSPLTAVLPDSYSAEAGHLLFDFTEYPEDTHLLLCSDGLYDGFTNFKEIYDWLNEHRAELEDAGPREQLFSELHDRLNRTKGDDDISFIWLRPPKAPAAGKAGAAEQGEGQEDPHGEDGESARQVFFVRWLAALLRRCGLKIESAHRPRRELPSGKR